MWSNELLPTFDFGMELPDDGSIASLKVSAKDKESKESNKRLARCGKCNSCTRQDCGTCYNCADKPKFGGPGVKKQACINRKCLLMVPKEEEPLAEKAARKRTKQQKPLNSPKRAPSTSLPLSPKRQFTSNLFPNEFADSLALALGNPFPPRYLSSSAPSPMPDDAACGHGLGPSWMDLPRPGLAQQCSFSSRSTSSSSPEPQSLHTRSCASSPDNGWLFEPIGDDTRAPAETGFLGMEAISLAEAGDYKLSLLKPPVSRAPPPQAAARAAPDTEAIPRSLEWKPIVPLDSTLFEGGAWHRAWHDPLELQAEFIEINERHRRDSKWSAAIAAF